MCEPPDADEDDDADEDVDADAGDSGLRDVFGDRPGPEDSLQAETIGWALRQRLFGGNGGGDGGPPRLGKFELIRQLGAGGMGLVFEASDVETHERVALKTLDNVEAQRVYKLKEEFRALSGVRHSNLVELYELYTDGSRPHFTMELVEGADLWAHLGVEPGRPASDRGRLRRVLRSLVAAVEALHAAALLHLDLKPTNVMVDRDGTLKLLDFGLARRREPDPLRGGTDLTLGGTPRYMAPEQALGLPVSPATDWYAVGVMLYEALTGRPPFDASDLAALVKIKDRGPPPDPALWTGRAPTDLDALCLQLLSPDPGARPSSGELRRRLGAPTLAPPDPSRDVSAQEGLVGRDAELAALHEALADSRRGRLVTVHLSGRPGVGKSTLVRRFAADLAGDDGTIVVAGRCYERESVPYRGFDSLIDGLTRYLKPLPDEVVAGLLPRHLTALTRLFPVLLRVPAIAHAPKPKDTAIDARVMRGRAFAALKELFARIADRHPLVVSIDDFHWSDVDSVQMLRELQSPPDTPAMLLVISYRAEDAARNPAVADLDDARGDPDLDVRDVALGPLSPADAGTLVSRLLGSDAPPEVAGRIVGESGGNALVAIELVREQLAGTSSPTSDSAVSLETLVGRRLATLPPEAVRLMHVLAIATAPLRRSVAMQAAALREAARAAEAALCAVNLARRARWDDEIVLEPYHDRIREVVADGLEPDARRRHHRALALAIETEGDADAARLAHHWGEAGDDERAAEHAIEAARQAARALAFDQAARLYRFALERGGYWGAFRASLKAALGDALALAGRGVEAAEALLDAATEVSSSEAFDLRRRAAAELLRSGHVARGRAELQTALADLGMRLPTGRFAVIGTVLYERTLLRLRGRRFVARDASDVPPALLRRIDLCDSAATGLIGTDPVVAAAFHLRALRLALRAGEPGRIARMLSYLAIQTSFMGLSDSMEILEEASALAERTSRPEIIATVDLSTAATHASAGRWIESMEAARRALDTFTNHCTGVYWELAWSRFYVEHALFWLGRLAEVFPSQRRSIAEAEARGDLLAASIRRLSGVYACMYLAADDPDAAQTELERSQAAWPHETVDFQNWYALQAETLIAIYRRDAKGGWDNMERKWPRTRRSLLSRHHGVVRATGVSRHAAVALLMAREAAEPEPYLRVAERDAEALARESIPWVAGATEAVRATVAAHRGDQAAALAGLDRAIEAYDRASMSMNVAAGRWHKGRLVGGDGGAELVAGAERAMRAQGIRRPDRMVEVFFAGFPDPEPAPLRDRRRVPAV